ncbi:hypothetical protein [Vibrio parahaemolyticus]|uniref:hypothetical protein n=1 Tax=Vibrio parahaemolyticus TaxID=670 RepID=UPI001A1CBD12|nr:hypothetical protein [Vibrio parahaemolyticus]HAS6381051.1 hypothetical protein [Vibrio vulnificus]EJG1899405.1 hypothetical protein [Vibrio parahaemolyticus]MDS1787205.1 hypothetical protein [Vibrio parahaemolyticus]HBC3841146.1 hypothetical protein [Vibrio parahaemolyticus]HDY7642408.1 hypothetical protein [Vibrio vulnificus]
MNKNYHYFLGVLFALLILNLYYFAGLVIEERIVPKSVEYWVGFFNSATGAMSGALLAFVLHDRQERKKIEKIRIENLQSTLLLLAVKLNQLRHIKYNLLEPHKGKVNWWCSVVAYHDLEIKEPFKLTEISFIQSSMYKFLLELSIADEAYSTTVDFFNARSRLHREKLQPAQKLALEENDSIPIDCSNIHEFLEPTLIEEMKVATNGAYDQSAMIIENLENLQTQLFEYCTNQFPEENFLDHDKVFRESENLASQ